MAKLGLEPPSVPPATVPRVTFHTCIQDDALEEPDPSIGKTTTSRLNSQEGLGKAVNPHLFRDSAATTLAIEDPQHVRLATTLLGHRHTATTERYYQHAQSLEAHREFVDVLGKIRDDDGRR